MTSIRITDLNKLAPGDVATFHVTGQMKDASQFTGPVWKSHHDGLWRVGPVWVYDPSHPAWNSEVFFVYAYREVPLPTEEWSVIANVQTAEGTFTRGMLVPDPQYTGNAMCWCLFDTRGYYSTCGDEDILDFTLPELL